MLNEKLSVPIAILVLAMLFSYNNIYALPKYIGIFALIVLVSLFAKKIAGYFREIKVTEEIWDFRRYGLPERKKFKSPVPIGIFLPAVLLFFTYGALKWLAVTQTNFEAKISKKIKKTKWSLAEVGDFDIALICFAGILSSIFLALISFGFSREISLLSILYAFFNLVPIGKLDGTRLLFSSKIIYFIAVLVLAAASVILALLQI